MIYHFIVDANLPDRLVNFLKDQGHLANHIRRMRLPTDEAVWAKAIELNAVVISQDADFLTLLKQDPRARLIYDKRGNRPFNQIMQDYGQAWPTLIEQLNNEKRLIELA